MRTLKVPLFVLWLGIALPSADAQVLLAPKMPDQFFAELKYNVRRTLKTAKEETKDRTESTLILGLAVVKSGADGGKVVALKVESIKQTQIDDAGKPKDITQPALQGAAVQLTLDSGLNISKVEGVNELLKKLDPKGTAKPVVRAHQLEYYENVFRHWAGEVFVPLPAAPVKVGDKWTQKTVRTVSAYGNLRLTKELSYQGTQTVGGQELHKLTFTTAHAWAPLKNPDAFPFQVVRVSINKGEYSGTIWFDATAGRIVNSEMKDLRDLSMTLSYEALNRDVRSNDEGTGTMRILDKNPAP